MLDTSDKDKHTGIPTIKIYNRFDKMQQELQKLQVTIKKIQHLLGKDNIIECQEENDVTEKVKTIKGNNNTGKTMDNRAMDKKKNHLDIKKNESRKGRRRKQRRQDQRIQFVPRS